MKPESMGGGQSLEDAMNRFGKTHQFNAPLLTWLLFLKAGAGGLEKTGNEETGFWPGSVFKKLVVIKK